MASWIDIAWTFVNQGWVGNLFGLIGIGFAIFTIFKRNRGQLVFHSTVQRLVRQTETLFPAKI
ncbi:hypothetical protein, partial [Escherichia coli]|uniref:hypothetical protein n=1 Tax=Escherichia coli TaxID=562 RepID=UPI003CFE5FE0